MHFAATTSYGFSISTMSRISGSSSMSTLFMNISFFFNDTATTEIYTLSLHDALPICGTPRPFAELLHRYEQRPHHRGRLRRAQDLGEPADRKSTRLNSSHSQISY